MSFLVEVLPRYVVEQTAQIIGPASAAARAIACADRGEHGPNPVFCRSASDRTRILVMAEEDLGDA